MSADETRDETMAEARRLGLPTADVDAAQPVFLRVGGWNPADPRSRNYAVGDIEMGLSVYELDADGQPVTPPDGEWSEDDLRDRLRSDAPKFLVQGTVIAWGGEGEPLLEKARVVGGFAPRRSASPSP